jgi:bisphosphoglycerate-dependent phosphoglycerate mutase
VKIEVSPGEFYDRYTILVIKTERITNLESFSIVRADLDIATKIAVRHFSAHPRIELVKSIIRELKITNERLWDIEDGLRACEARQDFGEEFIELARASYKTNDERSAIKRQINELLQSDMSEEKQYAKY